MYKIKKQPYGLHLTFAGHIPADEMECWFSDFNKQVDEMESTFYVFVDMREMKMIPPDAQPALRKGQEYAHSHGMERSVVIVRDDVIRMQLRKIARQTGIIEWERYIDASVQTDWEQIGMDWIIDTVDPDPENMTGPIRVFADVSGSGDSLK